MPIINKYPATVIQCIPPMIEKPDLTLEILRYFAKDEVPYPANLQVSDVYAEFPDKDQRDVAYSIICAIQTELLVGDYKEIKAFEGSSLVIGFLSGLSQRGGEYVRNATANNHYDKAISCLKKANQAITTAAISNTVTRMVETAIQSFDFSDL